MFKLFLATVLVASQVALAAPTAFFSGKFEMKSAANNHHSPMTGKMELLFETDKIASVKLELDKAVFTKTSFESKEQYFFTLTRAGLPTQVAAVFKLKMVPHTWFYVFVLDESATAGKFLGKVFKVKDTPDKIEAELNKGIDLSGATAFPATWADYGTAELDALPH